MIMLGCSFILLALNQSSTELMEFSATVTGCTSRFALSNILTNALGRRPKARSSGLILTGNKGRISAPRHRVMILMLVSKRKAHGGYCTPHVLSSIVGLWIHVAMYRRPLMAVLDAVFSEGRDCPPHEVFTHSRKARNELFVISSLGPVAQTDLRASVANCLYAIDASASGGGITRADISSNLASELWRHSEQRGYYNKLQSATSALLTELGIYDKHAVDCDLMNFSDPAEYAELSLLLRIAVPLPGCFGPPRELAEGILVDAIEIFRGSGNWSLALSCKGLRVHEGIEKLDHGDILDDECYRYLLALALRGVVREWHLGRPCLTFGTLRRPRLRSKQLPAGYDITDPLTREHNRMAWRTAFHMQIVTSTGNYISCEQPGNSVMIYMHIFVSPVRRGCVISRFAFCNYRSPFNKPSRWIHNKPWLCKLGGPCSCSYRGRHFIVEGSFTADRLQELEERCGAGGAAAVYGASPSLGVWFQLTALVTL